MTNRLLLLIGLIPLSFSISAQDSITSQVKKVPEFINNEANVIQGIESLNPFFERLHTLKNRTTKHVSILHIGDSHIQADFLTAVTREQLQKEFGNAGIGLTFPGRAARTNESPQIYSSSKGEWEISKITTSQNKEEIGIGGTALITSKVGNSIMIKVLSEKDAFDRLTLFFDKRPESYNIIVKDSAGQTMAVAGPFEEGRYYNTSNLKFPHAVTRVQLETSQFNDSQKQLRLYGLSLEKSEAGVLYHVIGMNGARYRHFLASEELINETAALASDLIVISLGTNEASDHPSIDPQLDKQINSLVEKIKLINPTSSVLLTTPSDFFKKRTRRNPGIATVRNKIIDVAKANQLAYWDLYEIAGGNHAADRWKKAKLLQADGIHFTKKGYELQGSLLYEAIIKGYNEYVLHRYSETH